ncbi:energy transducer TonB [Mucilaginibacter sp. CAU 1740]|uniref:energy transducer TonB n=1 Tax=Mucilaginibacter sp. CAU 1740 TaxID=3140365 RepID=UPI00325C24F7
MLITKFDLYKNEWLDLVFDHRNKNYGAYELRNTYAKTLNRAMAIAFSAVTVLSIATIVFKAHGKDVDKRPETMIDVKLTQLPPPPKKEDRIVEPKAEPAKPAKAAPATPTIKYTIPKVVPDDDKTAIDPPTKAELDKSVIGPETVKSDGPGAIDPGLSQGGHTDGPGVTEDNGVHSTGEVLEVMPEPVGGAAAWAKFLQKNLRFPPAAQDAGVSGKVFMSFVVEKDGSLSNIKVDRGAGYGFDEEATRVLKLAKAWKPGVQNGQNVRVRYSIPISFLLSPQE